MMAPYPSSLEDNATYMHRQYEKRYARIKRARGATMEELYKLTNTIIDENDG